MDSVIDLHDVCSTAECYEFSSFSKVHSILANSNQIRETKESFGTNGCLCEVVLLVKIQHFTDASIDRSRTELNNLQAIVHCLQITMQLSFRGIIRGSLTGRDKHRLKVWRCSKPKQRTKDE